MTTAPRTETSVVDPPGSRSVFAHRASSALLVVAFALVILGDVLSFNQLATQSPTDAILQIVVFSIGAAGIVEGVRRLAVPTSNCPRRSALAPGLLGVLAIATWRAQAPVGFAVIITAAAAIVWGANTFRILGGVDPDQDTDTRQILGLFSFAQTIVFVFLALLAGIDAGSTLFG